MDIEYSDGAQSETWVLKLIEASSDLGSEASPAVENYHHWPARYHLCPERANLVRHLDFEGLDVLELGAGMGGVSRFLAEKARTLSVVEGTRRRYETLAARLKGLGNWDGKVGNLDSVTLERKYDVVCVVGVLEYSELYVKPEGELTPFQVFLRRCLSHLKPEGVLLLAIENRIGLKYWSGAGEDHTGALFDGICGYPSRPTPRTFSRRELHRLFEGEGIPVVQEYLPFPDYKVSTSVLTPEFCEAAPRTAAELATTQAFENYTAPRARYFPDPLAAHTLSDAGLLPEFANSFLFLASREPHSPIARKLRGREEAGETAWHCSTRREKPTRTAFFSDGQVSKGLLSPQGPLVFQDGELVVRWNGGTEKLIEGPSLREKLYRLAYYGDWDRLTAELQAFLEASKGKESIDGIFVNAIVQDGYRLFDQEWTLEAPMPRSWFVFRNVLAFSRDLSLFSREAPYANLRGLYERLCARMGVAPQFEIDLARESRFQTLVSSHKDLGMHREAARAAMEFRFGTRVFPRSPEEEARLRDSSVRRAARALARELKRKAKEWLA